ncbi:DMT family transporter [Pelagibius sp. Alg239-R121]|uniref:DMT family transporter n=1 Tax=Pelagibius sp. Alg239-R121 TaxID=2993448 RepID=UPI0024A6AC0B|nr:DMT family transporter [Pelagibius sp. Alg239-R121]
MPIVLLSVVVVTWGVSWYGITLQIGEAAETVSISYRFALASAILFLWLIVTKRWKPIPLTAHLRIATLGFCLFNMNYLLFYIATGYIASGVSSVVFSTAAIFGSLNQWIFFGKSPERRVLAGAVCGVAGLAFLFSQGLREVNGMETVVGLALAVTATYFFSLGNLVSVRLSADYDLSNIVARAMAYGAALCALYALVFGQSFAVPMTASYLLGLAYLSVIASVIAFLAYLTLLNRVGPARAAYATVLFPLVALAISSGLEGYEWTLLSFIGISLALFGAALVFLKRPG